MQQPKFTLDDIAYADSPAMFQRAQDLYDSNKVGDITENQHSYYATVKGTHLYQVNISKSHIDKGDCNCYMGNNGMLCKHMLALGLAVLQASGKTDVTPGKVTIPTELNEVKPLVTTGFSKLKPYRGPSRIWFNYQRSLATGAGIIANAVSALPPTKENALYLWKLIERIDRKLMNGVDDSDGVVGECAAKIMEQLADYASKAPELDKQIQKYCKKKTNFDFEDSLQACLNNEKR
jgi:SWIM zinc finger